VVLRIVFDDGLAVKAHDLQFMQCVFR